MNGRSETVSWHGWTQQEVASNWEALPLLDGPQAADAGDMPGDRLHWISAAIALALLVLGLLDLLPPAPG